MKDEGLEHVSGLLWEGAHVELDASWWVWFTRYGEPPRRPWTTPIFSGKCWGQHVSGEGGFPEASPVTSFPFLLPWLLPGRNKCPRILDTPTLSFQDMSSWILTPTICSELWWREPNLSLAFPLTHIGTGAKSHAAVSPSVNTQHDFEVRGEHRPKVSVAFKVPFTD